MGKVWWEPLLQQGELDFSPAERRLFSKAGFSPGLSDPPALKRKIMKEQFFRSAEALLPRINAGAPTKKYVHQAMF